MIYYDDTQSKMNYFMADVRENTDPLDFGENGVSFMFGISNIYRSKYFNEEKFGSFDLQ